MTTQKVIQYIAKDGKPFSNQKDCQEYEEMLDLTAIFYSDSLYGKEIALAGLRNKIAIVLDKNWEAIHALMARRKRRAKAVKIVVNTGK
jgi:hypothetical protein